ncbi:4-(cytidine 5'-diphospho)-2-C-methyl-D-erythritol kinase [Prochlorococcus sp. MIT 1341]|uniref:4-(cytidine 5'-diphospho)-2-C-methyl-D-erythritol kinase n=1 Tax=Prochlorococcus sp. MIT 1341 TaxID=3096221 RepID=UPI002A74A2E7|nr:4-(cytidine 5'-diphospho)-2-C-methyl-D-erythritol kinase [Prochlorococcus sp. MIT 1341]
MLVSAPAKINLHLEVLGFRTDGFHELAMVMQSIDLVDQLEIKENRNGLITLQCDVPELSTSNDNLIIRSGYLLRDKTGLTELGAEIHLKKAIPIGAGLAGGSTDAAAALIGLNQFWGTGLSLDQLEVLASELGSDVPFCLAGGTQLCFGRGEVLEPQLVEEMSLAILLVKDPSVSVSTPWAYGKFRETEFKRYLTNELDFESRRKSLRRADWLNPLGGKIAPPLHNDLNKVVEENTPSVKEALSLLREIPQNLGAAMSGSGPSCFALFSDLTKAQAGYSQYRDRLEKAGFQSWCCALSQQGVKIERH